MDGWMATGVFHQVAFCRTCETHEEALAFLSRSPEDWPTHAERPEG